MVFCPHHVLTTFHICSSFHSLTEDCGFGLQLHPRPHSVLVAPGVTQPLKRRAAVSSQTTVPDDFWSTYLWAWHGPHTVNLWLEGQQPPDNQDLTAESIPGSREDLKICFANPKSPLTSHLSFMFPKVAQVGSVDHFRMVLATTSQLWDRRNFSLIHWLQGEDRSQGSSLLTIIWHTMPTEQNTPKSSSQVGSKGTVS